MIVCALICLVLVFPLLVLVESACWPGSYHDPREQTAAHRWFKAAGGGFVLGSVVLLIAGLLRWAWSFL